MPYRGGGRDLTGFARASFPDIDPSGLGGRRDENAPTFLEDHLGVVWGDAEIFGDGDVVGFVVGDFDGLEVGSVVGEL